MASISSSVINKSGRKFAPKVPVRRGGPAPAGSSVSATRKPETDARAASQQPQHQPATVERTPPPQPTSQNNDVATGSPSEALITERRSSQSRPRSRPASRDNRAVPIPVPARRRDSSTAASPPSPHATRISVPPRSPTVTTRPSPAKSSTPQVSQSQAGGEPSSRSADGQQRAERRTPSTTGNRSTAEPSASLDGDVEGRPAKRIRTTGPSSRRASEPQPRDSTDKSSRKTSSSSGANTDKARGNRRKSAAEAADEVVADATQERKPRRRKREPTPDDAESTEIMSGVVKMADLCKDIRIGKKSRREIELQNMDGVELERKRKERAERRKKEDTAEQRNGSVDAPTAAGSATETPDSAAAAVGGPKMRIVNGEIVLDTTSLQIDRQANADRSMDNMEAVEENPLTRKINSSSFGKRAKAEIWDKELTDLFYRGLRMFGTDFMMISKMFPGRTRRHIKLKFSNEERRNPEKIKDALTGPRESVTLQDYSDMTNTVFDDPRVVERELEEDKKKIEEQHALEKEAREELLRNPEGGANNDNILPSIENGNENNTTNHRRNDKKNTSNSYSVGG